MAPLSIETRGRPAEEGPESRAAHHVGKVVETEHDARKCDETCQENERCAGAPVHPQDKASKREATRRMSARK